MSTVAITEHLASSSLQKVLVGPSQSRDAQFNVVEASHSVRGVCSILGSFIKFIVILKSKDEVMIVEQSSQTLQHRFPSSVVEKNRKDKLYNKIVSFCIAGNYSWEDPATYGKPFISDLCNSLWYIDGHHVFSSRSCPIPSFFSSFTGFNRPELSKHRKRSISNMCRDRLLELSSVLQDHVTSSWMEKSNWTTFKQPLTQLIESLHLI